MQLASLLAALAIGRTKTGIAHSISYPLTSVYKVPHGIASSFVLPEVFSVTLSGIVTLVTSFSANVTHLHSDFHRSATARIGISVAFWWKVSKT